MLHYSIEWCKMKKPNVIKGRLTHKLHQYNEYKKDNLKERGTCKWQKK